MKTISDPETFKKEIESLPKCLIAVDGVDGVGKSKLISPSISTVLNIPVISTDCYVDKDGNEKDWYLVGSKLETLRRDIKSEAPGVVVDGAVIRDTLDKLKIKPTIWIYVKRMADWGWCERNFLDEEHVKEWCRRAPPEGDCRKYVQYLNYHQKYQPHQKADLVLEIKEDAYVSWSNDLGITFKS
jgi:hypothetical protein